MVKGCLPQILLGPVTNDIKRRFKQLRPCMVDIKLDIFPRKYQ